MVQNVELIVEPERAWLKLDGVDISEHVSEVTLSPITGRSVPMLEIHVPFLRGKVSVNGGCRVFVNGNSVDCVENEGGNNGRTEETAEQDKS